MQRKLLVALQLKVEHRFIEGLASGRANRVKDPGAFGATPTAQTWLFNPYQLPTHGCPCRRAHRSTVTQSRRGGGCANKLEKLTRVNSDGLFGILHTHQGLFAPHTRFPGLLLRHAEQRRSQCRIPYGSVVFAGALYTFPAVARMSRVAVSRIWAGFPCDPNFFKD